MIQISTALGDYRLNAVVNLRKTLRKRMDARREAKESIDRF